MHFPVVVYGASVLGFNGTDSIWSTGVRRPFAPSSLVQQSSSEGEPTYTASAALVYRQTPILIFTVGRSQPQEW